MGVELRLLPFDGPWFSHTLLSCPARPELFAEIQTTLAPIERDVPDDFATFTSHAQGAARYGITRTTAYGLPLKYVRAGELLGFAQHRDVTDDASTRAIWAYLAALDPERASRCTGTSRSRPPDAPCYHSDMANDAQPIHFRARRDASNACGDSIGAVFFTARSAHRVTCPPCRSEIASVCLAGEPTILNRPCGDPLCVCAPVPGVRTRSPRPLSPDQPALASAIRDAAGTVRGLHPDRGWSSHDLRDEIAAVAKRLDRLATRVAAALRRARRPAASRATA